MTLANPLEDNKILTVSELNRLAKGSLEACFSGLTIKGELSNVAKPRSGHWYFTLKDSRAQVRCAMFKGSQRGMRFIPEDGMEIMATGQVSLYEARGDYQLIVSKMEPAGVGALQQAFEALKEKLKNEGLFEASHKKPLPLYPTHIGVISSSTGAALQDILSVISRRFPVTKVSVFHAQVQGKLASQSLIKALHAATQQPLDVLILSRGGGSLEDLWGFNDEGLARALFDCPIPIVSGIGHEVDFTIADFVADLRAPTPSAAAESVTPDKEELEQVLKQRLQVLRHCLDSRLNDYARKLDILEKSLVHPGERVKRAIERCQNLLNTATLLMQQRLNASRLTLEKVATQLHALSPLATLTRGYAIVTDTTSQHVVHSIHSLNKGDAIGVQLSDGKIKATVTNILEENVSN